MKLAPKQLAYQLKGRFSTLEDAKEAVILIIDNNTPSYPVNVKYWSDVLEELEQLDE